jgi:hypothetical protein
MNHVPLTLALVTLVLGLAAPALASDKNAAIPAQIPAGATLVPTEAAVDAVSAYVATNEDRQLCSSLVIIYSRLVGQVGGPYSEEDDDVRFTAVAADMLPMLSTDRDAVRCFLIVVCNTPQRQGTITTYDNAATTILKLRVPGLELVAAGDALKDCIAAYVAHQKAAKFAMGPGGPELAWATVIARASPIAQPADTPADLASATGLTTPNTKHGRWWLLGY